MIKTIFFCHVTYVLFSFSGNNFCAVGACMAFFCYLKSHSCLFFIRFYQYENEMRSDRGGLWGLRGGEGPLSVFLNST